MEKKETMHHETITPSADIREQESQEQIGKPRRRGKGKIPPKKYKVIVIYSEITEEEARIKRAIIEGILKKPYLK